MSLLRASPFPVGRLATRRPTRQMLSSTLSEMPMNPAGLPCRARPAGLRLVQSRLQAFKPPITAAPSLPELSWSRRQPPLRLCRMPAEGRSPYRRRLTTAAWPLLPARSGFTGPTATAHRMRRQEHTSGSEQGQPVSKALISSLNPQSVAVQFSRPVTASGTPQALPYQLQIKLVSSYDSSFAQPQTSELTTGTAEALVVGKCVLLRDHELSSDHEPGPSAAYGAANAANWQSD